MFSRGFLVLPVAIDIVVNLPDQSHVLLKVCFLNSSLHDISYPYIYTWK
jgi:hypothetical protein